MPWEEDLAGERQFARLNEARQSELIAGHCRGIEERIRDARSRSEAEAVADEACRAFGNECPSAIIREALSRHVGGLMTRYWNGK